MTGRPSDAAEFVAADRPGSFLVRVGGRDQSHVDLEDPTRLVFDYVRRMADVLDAAGEPGAPLRVLHVGGAGLTLPRYVATTRPGSWQAVLEPDEELTARVRDELPLPRRSGIRVRPVDGRGGLPGVRTASVDAVVLDAYRDGLVPPDLLTVECFAEVARVLAPRGLLLVNLSDQAPFTLARDVVGGLRECFGALLVGAEPATLKGRRPGNLLLVAADGAVPSAALRGAGATSVSPYRVVDGADVGSFFGGGTPLRDA
ncbi:MAG: spermidine synthase [Nocardioidaceae bacterium]